MKRNWEERGEDQYRVRIIQIVRKRQNGVRQGSGLILHALCLKN